jgi:hypothetical protein
VLLAAASAATLEGAEQMAGALSRQGLFYVAAVEAAVIVVLFGALAWSWSARLRDNQKMLRETIEAIQQGAINVAGLTKAIQQRLPKVKLVPPEKPP